MKVYIDADGCPVVDETISVCRSLGVECIIICDTSHIFKKENIRTIVVSKGADSADFTLVSLINPGDIAITQDYGLAAMCLARKAIVISQDGMEYNRNNIDALLMQRHIAKKVRRAGGHFKGNPKRNEEQDKKFIMKLERVLEVGDKR